MNFRIKRKDFIEALTIGGALAGKAKSMGILDYAKVYIKNNQMVVSSSDNEVYVTKRVFINPQEEDVDFCVCANEVIKALRTLKEEDIDAEVNIGSMNIKHQRGKMKFNINDAKDFPTMERDEKCQCFNIEVENLFEKLDLARRFTAEDQLRPVMCGVLLYMDGDTFGVCASDGRKLFTDSIKTENHVDEYISAIIPSKGCQTVLNTINGNDVAKVAISSRNIIFAVKNARVSCRLIDGRFPNFSSVIPQNNTNIVSVNKKELSDSINRASLFSNTQSQLLSFAVSGMEMSINAEDIDFNKRSKETIPVEHSGEDITIGLKYDIAALCISCVNSESVTIKMSSPEKAIIYTDDSNPYRVILQMPMMLNQ